jgi:hypothetical protein
MKTGFQVQKHPSLLRLREPTLLCNRPACECKGMVCGRIQEELKRNEVVCANLSVNKAEALLRTKISLRCFKQRSQRMFGYRPGLNRIPVESNNEQNQNHANGNRGMLKYAHGHLRQRSRSPDLNERPGYEVGFIGRRAAPRLEVLRSVRKRHLHSLRA